LTAWVTTPSLDVVRAEKNLPLFRPPAALLVLAPFLLLAVLFVGTDMLAMRRVAQLREGAELIEQDMLSDVELLSRMQGDLGRVKLLADRHVFEHDSDTMAHIEDEIAQVASDFEAAARSFESTPMLPAERAPWQDLRGAVADLRQRLDGVLALSRVNDDARSYRALVDLEGDFDRTDRSLRELFAVNRQAADEGEARVVALQKSATGNLQVLAIVGVALSVILGGAVVRTLQNRNQRLQAINRELDAFAGRVAHDLRAPLTTATLATARLSRQSPSTDQVRTFDVLQRSFERMTRLIEDLLTISRAETNEPRAVCDPAAAAEELREELAPRASSEEVDLVIDVQPARVRCSEGLFRQVMWNLADNAMKYRRPETRPSVEIYGRATGDRYELSVRDNGVGIDPAETGKIFEAFYRAAGCKGKPGTGLGLSIVKRAVEANGGTVSVTSKVGSGTKFVAKLPIV
jgi:signal transduction histidine kinase